MRLLLFTLTGVWGWYAIWRKSKIVRRGHKASAPVNLYLKALGELYTVPLILFLLNIRKRLDLSNSHHHKGKSSPINEKSTRTRFKRDAIYLLETVEDLTFIRRGPVYFLRPLRKSLSTLSRSASLQSVEENQNVSKASATTPSASGLQTNKTVWLPPAYFGFLSFHLTSSSNSNVAKD